MVGLEDVLFMRGIITIKNILQTVSYLSTIFIDNLSYPNKRHILPSMIVHSRNKRILNQKSLLSLVLQTAKEAN